MYDERWPYLSGRPPASAREGSEFDFNVELGFPAVLPSFDLARAEYGACEFKVANFDIGAARSGRDEIRLQEDRSEVGVRAVVGTLLRRCCQGA